MQIDTAEKSSLSDKSMATIAGGRCVNTLKSSGRIILRASVALIHGRVSSSA